MEPVRPRPAAHGIFFLAGIWCLVVLAAVIAPRFVPAAEGFAGGAAAILLLLALLSLAALIAIWLLLQTLPRFRDLGTAARIAGTAPCIVNLVAIAWIWLALQY